jgi:hypothetical protein
MAEIPATIHVSLILEMYFIDFSEMESKERKMKHGRIDPRFISCEIEGRGRYVKFQVISF